MRLFELKGKHGKLPAKAGLATLEWSEGNSTPERKGETILLPNNPGVEFFHLGEGQQFLVHTIEYRRNNSWGGTQVSHSQLFFGGTDEQPFLVELDPVALMTLSGGENAFFSALRPSQVVELETQFGQPATRQGDWFAVPLPPLAGPKDLLGIVGQLSRSKALELTIKDTGKGLALRSTRHIVKAGWISTNPILLGEGLLTAPDHADITLEGPHAFFQTAHLVRPQAAD